MSPYPACVRVQPTRAATRLFRCSLRLMISEMQTGNATEVALPNRSQDFLEKPGIKTACQTTPDPTSDRFTGKKSTPAGNQ